MNKRHGLGAGAVSVLGLLILMLGIMSGAAWGEMVFGPKEYSRAEGVNQTLTDNFVASPGNNYKLVFYNNENIKPNTFLWDQLQIKVNGQDVYGATCFSMLQYKVNRPLVLKGENTLEVKLKGAKGCSPLTLQIEAEPIPQPQAKAKAKAPVIASAAKQSKGSLDTDPLYSYDVMGNRTKMTDPAGTTIYSYDILNRLVKITNPRGQVTRYTYDAGSRRTGMTYPNGMTATYTYDLGNRLLSLAYRLNSATIASFIYSYDYKGNRVIMIDEYGTHNYTYDKVNQLTQATHPQVNNPTEQYTYDSVGNRTTSGSVYNAGNRLLENSNYLYSYNKDGSTVWKKNKSTGEITRYTFNAIRELTDIKRYANEQSSTPITSARYYYDGLRRRIAKRVNGTLTQYVYDNEDIILELDASGNRLAYYTHGPSIDEPISVERNSQTYYYIADGLGSIVKLVDTAGNVVNNYVYDSFGNIMSKTETVTNYYTYTSREYDSESSLYYYRLRYYDPLTGRFMNCDPMGFSQGTNFYIYVRNNPVNYADSFGLWFTGVHGDMTIEAMKNIGGFADWQIEKVAESNKAVDDDQKADFKHYMPSTEKGAKAWIQNNWENAIMAASMNDSLVYLGRALHTIQDKWAHYVIGATLGTHAKTFGQVDARWAGGLRYKYALTQTEEYVSQFEALSKAYQLWIGGLPRSIYEK